MSELTDSQRLRQLAEQIESGYSTRLRYTRDEQAAELRRIAAELEADSLKAGDRIRFSVELLRQIDAMPDHSSELVEVVSISSCDGEKTVMLARLRSSADSDAGQPVSD